MYLSTAAAFFEQKKFEIEQTKKFFVAKIFKILGGKIFPR
jgi:hypothetical protein